MMDLRYYMLQRLSALIMVPLVVGHLAVMVYAIQGGLSASEILGRTAGSFAWAMFYGSFVAAAALHAAIGLRAIIFETFGLGGRSLAWLTWLCFAALGALGGQAVWTGTLGASRAGAGA